MRITIDNLDGTGARDYTNCISLMDPPHVHRKLNRPSRLELNLVADSGDFVVPKQDARIVIEKSDGTSVFTGLAVDPPEYKYLGWGERGPVYCYKLRAMSEEFQLDRKTLPQRSPFIGRTAGEILKQITEDLLPNGFDLSNVADLEVIPKYNVSASKTWSEHAAELGILARACYRMEASKLSFRSLGSTVNSLDESSDQFCPEALTLTRTGLIANDVIVAGRIEPQAYVKDYFVGDGLTLHFNLSEIPFTRQASTIFEEEYAGAILNSLRWNVADHSGAVSVQQGKLQIAGGSGILGETWTQFVEQIELGGAVLLQHGNFTFSGSSNGIIGGLYSGSPVAANCFAGFRISPSGNQSTAQALVSGMLVGGALTLAPNRNYLFGTRIYCAEPYRRGFTFHSSSHPAGSGRGGRVISADVHVVLEVHEIDPANPGTFAAPSTVLYDGTFANAPGECSYLPVNAALMYASATFTRVLRMPDVLVRSALPGQSYSTRLAGALIEGAECHISQNPALSFYGAYAPAPNELIVASYRSSGRAIARVNDQNSIVALTSAADDGHRGSTLSISSPAARTTIDCTNAAAALLDDRVSEGWTGSYEVLGSLLPGNADVLPGDAVHINAPSRSAVFDAIVREVEVKWLDPANDRGVYLITFANEAAEPLAFRFDSAAVHPPQNLVSEIKDAAASWPADLVTADITQVSSTTVTLDFGITLQPGYGIEVRRSDLGWGPDNDRNLIGRFSTRTATVPRLARVQDHFLRVYDASTPPRYSKHSTILHLDYPL